MVSYARYIRSTKWQRRRERYFSTHKKLCRACGTGKKIELHHKTYKNLGAERDTDLVPLCSKCHAGVHRIQKRTNGSLWMITEEFIRKKNGKNRKLGYRNSRLNKSKRN
jgi:5-methylcytosine-specific restriction endonuclease McrA